MAKAKNKNTVQNAAPKSTSNGNGAAKTQRTDLFDVTGFDKETLLSWYTTQHLGRRLDEKAANYLLRGISNSQDLLATIMNDGEAALASRIYADAVRSKVSRGT